MAKIYREAFKTHSTFGYPLVLQMGHCKKYNVAISIPDFWIDAYYEGWTSEKILSTVKEACFEVQGRVDSEKIMKELNEFIYIFHPKKDQDVKVWHSEMKQHLEKYWDGKE